MDTMHPLYLVVVSLGMASLPFMLGLATSYLKINIVLAIFKVGLGAQGVPGNLVIMALSLSLSMVVMGPVFEESFSAMESSEIQLEKIEPGKLMQMLSGDALEPWKEFLRNQTGSRELEVVREMNKSKLGEEGFLALLPAFVLSELSRAFQMGIMVLLPFLLIDLIVSSALIALGMFMVSPSMIALPLKLVLFTAADGWILLARTLVHSYGG